MVEWFVWRCFQFYFYHLILWFLSDELWKLKTHFRCFQFLKLSFYGIFIIKHTYMGPTVSAKSHQPTFWYYLQRLSSSIGTKSLLHLHTTIFFSFSFFGKLYHHLHTTIDRSSDPPSFFSFSFFFLVNYTTISIPPPIGAQTHHLLHPSWLHHWHYHLSLRPINLQNQETNFSIQTISKISDPLLCFSLSFSFKFFINGIARRLCHSSIRLCHSSMVSLVGLFRRKT